MTILSEITKQSVMGELRAVVLLRDKNRLHFPLQSHSAVHNTLPNSCSFRHKVLTAASAGTRLWRRLRSVDVSDPGWVAEAAEQRIRLLGDQVV